MNKKILVVAAHIGDFVWRCGGTISKYVQSGAEVHLIVLTYGVRGEMNSYWKNEGANEKEAKQIRHTEGMTAAKILGIQQVDVLDYEDYPMALTIERIEKLAAMIRAFAPDIILTHDSECDPYNADHTLVGEKIYDAISVAAAKGVDFNGLPAISRPKVFGFEPHVAEASNFKPQIYIDFTDVHEIKENAMKSYQSQSSKIGRAHV
jgi:4-oxalomesaconate hydratase